MRIIGPSHCCERDGLAPALVPRKSRLILSFRWRPDLPERSRLLLRHSAIVMLKQHCRRRVAHQIIEPINVVFNGQPI